MFPVFQLDLLTSTWIDADIVAEKARSFVYFDDDTSSNVSGGENFDPMRIQNRLDLGGPKPMW